MRFKNILYGIRFMDFAFLDRNGMMIFGNYMDIFNNFGMWEFINKRVYIV